MAKEPRRVLIVTDAVPFPPRNGKELPTAKFVDAFARQLHCDLLVISHDNKDFETRRQNIPRSVENVHLLRPKRTPGWVRAGSEILWPRLPAFYPRGFARRKVSSILRDGEFDAIWVSPVGGLSFVDYCRNNGWLDASKICLGLNDSLTMLYLGTVREAARGRVGWKWNQILRGLRLPLIYRAERRYLRASDLVHVQTDVERERVLRVAGRFAGDVQVVVAQNGRKEELLDVEPAGEESHDILYMTHLSGGRERESWWFLKHVWPRIRDSDPRAILHLVGTPPGENSAIHGWDLPRVRLRGYVDDLGALYGSVRVGVVPILHSSGLINRVLDGITAGLPIVATPGPLKTIPGLEPNVHAMSAQTPSVFADEVLTLLNDPDRWSAVSSRARELGRRQPSWEETTDRIIGAVEHLLNHHGFDSVGRKA